MDRGAAPLQSGQGEEDDLIPLSALQHWLFCPRQCALIHVEQMWAENRFTAEGRLLHDRAHTPKAERRRGVRTLTAVPLRSLALGVTGVADVVELRSGRPYPVEYKRGKPKAHRADEVQLCAQALCLEEMFGVAVPEGALFYGEPRRHTPVAIDDDLRALTRQVAAEARAALAAGRTPAAQYEKRKCSACSLIDACRPKATATPNAAAWLRRAIAGATEE
ncbi:MAG: CRISPR-associated protein Cas4 [Rhodospirillaceae bacterium]|nr:CRISPR-associated protein Cas4 [Rhodospirillaceae bacterium]